MSNELAQELKDAGFPGSEYWVGMALIQGINPDGSPLVNLSELIEACGEKFFRLTKGTKCWRAYDTFEIEVDGCTPEEAVARLWLALKKGDK